MKNTIEASNEEVEAVEVEPIDEALGMSDEDFMSANPEDFSDSPDNGIRVPGDETETEEQDEDNSGDDVIEEEASDSVNQDEPTDNAEDAGSEETEDEENSETKQPDDDSETDTVNYEAEFQKLFGEPIRAGGRETKIRNIEHARNFIEMGIDYSRKMHDMKPHMQALKTLEKEGLLGDGNQEKLNLLLDIQKGNKDALKRFIAESDVDVLDLADEDAIEAARSHVPQNHMVSKQEIELDDALKSISSSESYQQTVDAMTKTFDQKSREIISENPRYIVALNKDMENGIYNDIMDAVQYQRDMNLLPPGMSDVEAYIHTAQDVANQSKQAPSNQQEPTNNQQEQPNQQVNKRETKRRKVGMSSNKSSGKRKQPKYDPLSMSDEDFMKIDGMNVL